MYLEDFSLFGKQCYGIVWSVITMYGIVWSAKKQIKKSLELKKLSREKVINCILSGKVKKILLTDGLIKKT